MGLEHKNNVRLFQNPWLERLTKLSLRGFLIVWAVLIPPILWVARDTAGLVDALGLIITGLLIWSLTEYSLHRFLFHWRPRLAPLAKFVFMLHENHHVAPNDPLRNLMPPIVSLPVAGLVWAGCVALAGPAGTWMFLGFITGYIAYDLIHYGCHQWSSTDWLSGPFKAHHMRHHFAKDSGNYATTGIVWDHLFGTRIASSRN